MLTDQLASQLGMPSIPWDTCNLDRRSIKSNHAEMRPHVDCRAATSNNLEALCCSQLDVQ